MNNHREAKLYNEINKTKFLINLVRQKKELDLSLQRRFNKQPDTRIQIKLDKLNEKLKHLEKKKDACIGLLNLNKKVSFNHVIITKTVSRWVDTESYIHDHRENVRLLLLGQLKDYARPPVRI